MKKLQTATVLLLGATDGAYRDAINIFRGYATRKNLNHDGVNGANEPPLNANSPEQYVVDYAPSGATAASENGEELFAGTIKFLKGPVIDSYLASDVAHWNNLFFDNGLPQGICFVVNDEYAARNQGTRLWGDWYTGFFEAIILQQFQIKIDAYVLFLASPTKAQFDASVSNELSQRIRRFCLSGQIVRSPRDRLQSTDGNITDKLLERFLESFMVDLPIQTPVNRTNVSRSENGGQSDIQQGEADESEDESELSEDDIAAMGFDMGGLNCEKDDESMDESSEDELSEDGLEALGFNMEGLNVEVQDEEADSGSIRSNLQHESREDHSATGDARSEDGEENPDQMTFAELYFLLVSTGHIMKDYLDAECKDTDQEIQKLNSQISNLDDQISNEEFILQKARDQRAFWARREKLEVLIEVRETYTYKWKKFKTPDFKNQISTDFPIRHIQYFDQETTGKWEKRDIPADRKRFTYHIKNDMFKDAKCRFQVCGYRDEVYASEIARLDRRIVETESVLDNHKTKKKSCLSDLSSARTVKGHRDDLLAECKIDLERLRQPHLIDWNLAKVRKYVRSSSANGMASEFSLISRVARDMPLLRFEDRTRFRERAPFKTLHSSLKGTQSSFIKARALKNIKMRRDDDTQTSENLNRIKSIASGFLETKVCESLEAEIEKLQEKGTQRNYLWETHTKDLEELVKISLGLVEQTHTEFNELEKAANELQERLSKQFSDYSLAETLVSDTEKIEKEISVDIDACEKLFGVMDAEYMPIGVCAALLHHKTNLEGMASIYEGFRIGDESLS
ncbi:hypothetical protein ABW20_dc0101102 [Dactylellina cionopaga]|nr:hypothetical protein ABW20_dc0101102 [Dactylellina cionopaga]